MSAREEDKNGFIEIKSNPLSKVGVFKYLGKSIGLPGLDPNAAYNVYRPKEELENSEAIDSFKLLPWVDEHEMVGRNFTDVSDKPVEGVTGEEIFFEDGYLKGNIRIFSKKLADLINSGKKELSCGYRCKYELSVGEFEGQPYDVIQKDIRGNHLALVQNGRMGHEVAVLDSKEGIAFDHYNITLDQNGDSEMEKADLKKMFDEVVGEMKKEVMDEMKKVSDRMDKYDEEKKAKDEEEAAAKKKAEDEAAAKKEEDMKNGKKGEDKKSDEEKAMDEKFAAMDEKIEGLKKELADEKENGFNNALKSVQDRDALAKDLEPLVGAFDHAEKSIEEVASYALDKLEVAYEEGQEVGVIRGVLAAKGKEKTFALDKDESKAESSSDIDDYLNS